VPSTEYRVRSTDARALLGVRQRFPFTQFAHHSVLGTHHFLRGHGRANILPSNAPVTTSIRWCCLVYSVASQTTPAPAKVSTHQRGKSRTSAQASRHVRLTCRLGAALAGGSSMAAMLRYTCAVRPSPTSPSRPARCCVCVG